MSQWITRRRATGCRTSTCPPGIGIKSFHDRSAKREAAMWKWIALSLFSAMPYAVCAQFPDLQGLLRTPSSPSSPVSDDKAAAGLKEALEIGTGNAVNLTGRV